MRAKRNDRFWLLSWGVAFSLLLLLGRGRMGPAVSAGTCPLVQNTPSFTIVYGAVSLDGVAAPVGTVVTAVSPRDDVVGCFMVETAGNYGSMYVYGEDTSVNPPVPGMGDGETVAFRVDGAAASASPAVAWSNDRDLHQVDLGATSPPCYDFDNSGTVDIGDLTLIAGAWRATDAASLALYDLNGNNVVDTEDIMTVAKHLGEPC